MNMLSQSALLGYELLQALDVVEELVHVPLHLVFALRVFPLLMTGTVVHDTFQLLTDVDVGEDCGKEYCALCDSSGHRRKSEPHSACFTQQVLTTRCSLLLHSDDGRPRRRMERAGALGNVR